MIVLFLLNLIFAEPNPEELKIELINLSEKLENQNDKIKQYFLELNEFKKLKNEQGETYSSFNFYFQRVSQGKLGLDELIQEKNIIEATLFEKLDLVSKKIANKIRPAIIKNRPKDLNDLVLRYNQQLKEFELELKAIPKNAVVEADNKQTFKVNLTAFPQVEKDAMLFYHKKNLEARIEILKELINKVSSKETLSEQEYSSLEDLYVESQSKAELQRYFNFKSHVNNALYIYVVIIVKEGVMSLFRSFFTLYFPSLMSEEALKEASKTPLEDMKKEFSSLFTKEAVPGHLGFLAFGFASDVVNKYMLSKLQRKLAQSTLGNSHYFLSNAKMYAGKSFSRFTGMVVGMYVSHVVATLGSKIFEFIPRAKTVSEHISDKFGINIESGQSEINRDLINLIKKLLGGSSAESVLLGGASFEIAHYILESGKYFFQYGSLLNLCDLSQEFLVNRQLNKFEPLNIRKRLWSFGESVAVFAMADLIGMTLLGQEGFFKFDSKKEEDLSIKEQAILFENVFKSFLYSIINMMIPLYVELNTETTYIKEKTIIDIMSDILKELKDLEGSSFGGTVLSLVADELRMNKDQSCLKTSFNEFNLAKSIDSEVKLEDYEVKIREDLKSCYDFKLFVQNQISEIKQEVQKAFFSNNKKELDAQTENLLKIYRKYSYLKNENDQLIRQGLISSLNKNLSALKNGKKDAKQDNLSKEEKNTQKYSSILNSEFKQDYFKDMKEAFDLVSLYYIREGYFKYFKDDFNYKFLVNKNYAYSDILIYPDGINLILALINKINSFSKIEDAYTYINSKELFHRFNDVIFYFYDHISDNKRPYNVIPSMIEGLLKNIKLNGIKNIRAHELLSFKSDLKVKIYEALLVYNFENNAGIPNPLNPRKEKQL